MLGVGTLSKLGRVSDGSGLRVILVEDDQFARSVVSGLLDRSGYQVVTVGSAAEAIKNLDDFDPHVVLLDLDLGEGPSGLTVLEHVTTQAPWVAVVILSSHRSPKLVDPKFLPEKHNFVQLVKADVTSAEMISEAIKAALSGEKYAVAPQGEVVTLTAAQADVLRMIAQGRSNQEIADARGTGLRAAEAMIQRTLEALGIQTSDGVFGRVPAAQLYRDSKVDVSR